MIAGGARMAMTVDRKPAAATDGTSAQPRAVTAPARRKRRALAVAIAQWPARGRATAAMAACLAAVGLLAAIAEAIAF